MYHERFPFVDFIHWGYVRGITGFEDHTIGRIRNELIMAAREKYKTLEYVFFLDADDMIMPSTLSTCYEAAQETGRYIYFDGYNVDENGYTPYHSHEYSQEGWVHGGLHPLPSLIPLKWFNNVMFNEDLRAWEDYDFFTRLAEIGLCGERIPHPFLLYRRKTGTLTRYVFDNLDMMKSHVRSLGVLDSLQQGRYSMCCGNKKKKESKVDEMIRAREGETVDSNLVLMEYRGKSQKQRFYSKDKRRMYIGGIGVGFDLRNNPVSLYRFAHVDKRDVEHLKQFGFVIAEQEGTTRGVASAERIIETQMPSPAPQHFPYVSPYTGLDEGGFVPQYPLEEPNPVIPQSQSNVLDHSVTVTNESQPAVSGVEIVDASMSQTKRRGKSRRFEGLTNED